MNKSTQLSYLVLFLFAVTFTGFVLYWYTTTVGLHYYFIFFSSSSLFLLGMISLLISIFSNTWRFYYFPVVVLASALLTSAPLINNESPDSMTQFIGIILSSICIIAQIAALYFIFKDRKNS